MPPGKKMMTVKLASMSKKSENNLIYNGFRNTVRYLLMGLIIVAITGCAMRRDFKQGQEAQQQKDWDQAVQHYLKAVAGEPENAQYRISLTNALLAASNLHLNRGRALVADGQLKPALMEFEKALENNPANNIARNEKITLLKTLRKLEKKQLNKTEIQQIKEEAQGDEPLLPELEKYDQKLSLKFKKSDLKQVFKVISKSTDIDIFFDQSYKSKRITCDWNKLELKEALDRIMMKTGLFYKVINPKAVIVVPDTATNRKKYDELVMKTVFLSNRKAETLQKVLRSLTGLKTIAVDEEQNAITFKGRPEEVKMAEKIARIHDKPRGELFLNIEIIEANRSRLKDYGIELSQYQVTESYWPDTGSDFDSGVSTIRLHELGKTTASDFLLTLPSITYKLLRSDRNSRIKAQPHMRILDREKGEVRLGDKVPIPTTSFVPYNTGGPSQQPITSYQMQDIGINIEVTPQIHHDGQVTLELKFELTFITSPGSERLPPTIGNRSVNTRIKLRDNETSILAGLLRDTERKAMQAFPLLSNVPILKDIFGGNKNEVEQTDIILTLTPRIIRFPEIVPEDLEYSLVGTASRPGLKPNWKAPEQETAIQKSTEETARQKRKIENRIENKIKKKIDSKKEHSINKSNAGEVETNKENIEIKTSQKIKKNDIVSLVLRAPKGDLRINRDYSIPVTVTGSPEIRAVTLEMETDPTALRFLDIQKGTLLTQSGVNSQMSKRVDAINGKIKLTISLAKPVKVNGNDQLAIIRIKPLRAGEGSIRPVKQQVMDSKMRALKSLCRGVKFQVSKK
jgi:general secretion pathway protein D